MADIYIARHWPEKITLDQTQLRQYIPGSSNWTWYDALFSFPGCNRGPADKLSRKVATITTKQYDNIIKLFTTIIEPLTTQYGNNFGLNSCLRGPHNNTDVGGGAHGEGLAVDLNFRKYGQSGREAFCWIRANLPYQALIWETRLTGTPPPDGEPGWIHVDIWDYGPGRPFVAYYKNDVKQPNAVFRCNGIDVPEEGKGSIVSDEHNTKTPGVKDSTNKSTSLNEDKPLGFNNTFRQIEADIGEVEAAESSAEWGTTSQSAEAVKTGKTSNWLSAKQYLLYLCSRYTPQSLFPFIELIPAFTMDTPIDANTVNNELIKEGYVKDGTIPEDVEQNVAAAAQNNKNKNKAKKAQQLLDQLKFISEVPPGYSPKRFETGRTALNKASLNTDLFNLDPFQEGYSALDQLSDSGKIVKNLRNLGVRVYGQLVLNPAAVDGVPSKPGAIGFTGLEIKAGNQSDNGLALISMTLVDVQGNKFTDINSPWAFIYDVRPGSIAGDFYFRFGWQIRVPNPQNINTDKTAKLFWTHKGWAAFPELYEFFKTHIKAGRDTITLTQAINTRPTGEITDGAENYALFDEGVSFDETNGTITVKRDLSFLESNYVKLSILNPEIEIDEKGAITATLNFRTTGAIAQTIPVEYAMTTKKLVAKATEMTLGDLLIAVMNDMANASFLVIRSAEERKKQHEAAAKADYINATRTRNFDNLVYLVGPEDNGTTTTGNIHPDDVRIKIKKKLVKQLYTRNDSDMTLIRWVRNVLQANECELQSAATGSGAGINSAWIITTTAKTTIVKQQRKTICNEQTTISGEALSILTSEKDVFSYRFQGSLVEKLSIQKTDSPNALSIQVDYTVGDLATFDGQPDSLDKKLSQPAKVSDRSRNLTVLFSQMQNVEINCLAHPWIGPGRKFFVKGTGFFDGQYLALEVTHKLDYNMFTTNIKGARMLLANEEKTKDNIQNAKANGNNNFGEEVGLQKC
jgi:hypothetical protein